MKFQRWNINYVSTLNHRWHFNRISTLKHWPCFNVDLTLKFLTYFNGDVGTLMQRLFNIADSTLKHLPCFNIEPTLNFQSYFNIDVGISFIQRLFNIKTLTKIQSWTYAEISTRIQRVSWAFFSTFINVICLMLIHWRVFNVETNLLFCYLIKTCIFLYLLFYSVSIQCLFNVDV